MIKYFIFLVFILLSNVVMSQDKPDGGNTYLVYTKALKTGELSQNEIMSVARKTLLMRYRSDEAVIRFSDDTSLILDCNVVVTAFIGKTMMKDVYQYGLSVKINNDNTCELIADEYRSSAGRTVSREVAASAAEQAKTEKKRKQYSEINEMIYEYLELDYQRSMAEMDLALARAIKAKI